MAIDPDSAGSAAELAYLAFSQARPFAQALPRHQVTAEGVYDETISGPDGGDRQVQGRIETDGTGWLSITYRNFQDAGITLNGAQVTHYLKLTSDFIESIRVDFHNLRATTADFDQSVSGSITSNTSVSTSDANRTADLLFTDFPSRASLWIDGLHWTQSGLSYAFEGDAYDSGFGHIAFSTVEPIKLSSFEEVIPSAGGPWVITGQNGVHVWIEPLSPTYASLQLSSTSAPSPDRATRIRWDTPFFLQVNQEGNGSPVAVSEPDRVALIGERELLDARMSHHPDGRFQSFRWKILFAPPGSQAQIENTGGLKTAFEPDLPGDYIVALDANDGNHEARDVTTFVVDDLQDPSEATVRFSLPPARLASVGERITLDGTMVAANVDDLRYEWSVDQLTRDPDDSPTPQIPLEDADGPTPSFVPEAPGIYVVSASVHAFSVRATDKQIIAVDRPLPPFVVSAPTPPFGTGEDVLISDVTGDGIEDLVLSQVSGADLPMIYVYEGMGDGRFAAPTSINGGAGYDIRVVDISTDGRLDLAAATADGIELFRQSVVGELQSIGTLAESSMSCFSPDYRSLAVVDLNDDGYSDLVKQHSCRRTLDIFFQRADGSFEPSVILDPVPDNTFKMLAIGDVTGDSFDDILVTAPARHTGETPTLTLVRGGDRSSLMPEVIAELDGVFDRPLVTTADINEDDRDDAVVVTQHTAYVYFQDDTGDLVLGQALTVPVGSIGFSRDFIALVDIDGDKDLDIVTNRDFSAPTKGFGIYRQGDDGVFAPFEYIHPSPRSRLLYRSENSDPMAVSDLNGDGVEEVVTANGHRISFLFARPPILCGEACDGTESEAEVSAQSSSYHEKPEQTLSFTRESVIDNFPDDIPIRLLSIAER